MIGHTRARECRGTGGASTSLHPPGTEQGRRGRMGAEENP